MIPLILTANFIFIFLKAFQQKNVMKDRYKSMFLTSLVMGSFEVFVIGSVALIWVGVDDVVYKAFLAILVGASGGLGSIAGCLVHNRIKL